MSLKRGALIVLEGVDRSGKSTQCKRLVETLNKNNIKAELIIFPDRSTPIGKVIDEYLSNKEYKLHDKAIHLLFAANRWENVNKMQQLLKSGTTLIIDKYSYSGIAYSSIKPGMDLEWCKTQEIGLPKPDRVFLLTLKEEDMKGRPGFGTERYENKTIQKRVLNVYQHLFDSSWENIDASGTVDSVHNVLYDKIVGVARSVRGREVGELRFDSDNAENDINGMNCN